MGVRLEQSTASRVPIQIAEQGDKHMAKNIYIGNLNFDPPEDTLRPSFGAYGEVTSVNIVTARYSGRPRGFAFVEMENDEAAAAAISALNGQPLDGRQLRVDETRPRKSRWSDAGARSDQRW